MRLNEEIIIDATGAVLGRLASYSAKQALKGKKVIIVNSEKTIIVGKEKNILGKYHNLRAKGGSGLSGPFFPSEPEKILKRTIRGMLPYKSLRGREIFKSIRCYKGMPAQYKERKIIKSGKSRRGIGLDKISKALKGRK